MRIMKNANKLFREGPTLKAINLCVRKGGRILHVIVPEAQSNYLFSPGAQDEDGVFG